MSADSVPTFVIRPTEGRAALNLREIWKYRGLVYFLTWRDIKVRYKQTAIGIGWAVLQPLAMMIVFTLFFGRLARMPSEGIPYPLFTFAALLPWQLFSKSITESANSLVTDQKLITRVYFPRMIVPMGVVLASIVDFLIGTVLLILIMAYYGILPSQNIIWIPLFISLMLMTALGVGLWLSALNVEYRDVMYTVPFLNQFWLFITPVVYPTNLVPERWRVLYGLNPMVGVVEGFRWSLFGTGEGPSPMLLMSFIVAIVVLVSGLMWFRARERTFVDAVGSGGR